MPMRRATPRRGTKASRVAIPIALRVEAPAWRRQLPGAPALVRRAARAALGTAKDAGKAGELCLVLADDELQRKLNREFRGADKPTNVLSFEGAPAALGDVVLALETIAAEAELQGKSLGDHVAHLVVHGVLHLMGYDHQRRGQARRMERLETEILASLGIADPYVLPARRRRRAGTSRVRRPEVRQ
jgi:probable rRNA maturation factor